jgi:hypothetical protein
LSYVAAAALDRAGELPDPLCAPWHFLGVKLTKDEPANEKALPIIA